MASLLTLNEHAAIRALAGGDVQRRDDAIAAFHRVAGAGGLGSCAAMCYMSEVLNPVPDLLLRARYRKDVLAQAAPV